MNLKTWIAAGALAVVVVGGSITGATVHNAQVQADAQAQQVLVAKAEATAADQLAADAAAAQAVIDAAAAQKVIDDAAAAQAAADALAAQQAADAAAAQAAAQPAPAQRSTTSTTSWAPGQAPTGTPLPHHTETDPNNGKYGQETYDDPGQFCASRSGSTIGGVPQCD
jgi:membrane protein involved in colicin uptake